MLFWQFSNIIIYGQESPGWISLYKLVTCLPFFLIYRNSYCFCKIDLSMNSGQWWEGDSKGYQTKKNHFQNLTKSGNKVGKIYKVGPLLYISAFKLSKLCYHFLSSFENENDFYYIPSYPPPIANRNSLTNQFCQKKIKFLYIFKKKQKKTKCREGSRENLSLFLFLKIFRNINFLGKLDWSVYSGQRWAGDS